MSLKTRGHRTQAEPLSPESLPRPGKLRGRQGVRLPGSRAALGQPRPNRYLPAKTMLDLVAAALLLLPATPVILLAALLVKLTSRGPAFYKQTRLGRDGRPFMIYKIRTMIHKCESLTGPRWSIPGDPRITWIGQFLRASHVDELPQLLNVLRGDMSLIGPRPERPEFLPELEAAFPWYRERLLVRPGVTGLAQVQLPADTTLDSVRHKLTYDLYYIHNVGPWLDLRILLCTALYAVGVPFRLSRDLFRIPTIAPAPRPAPAEERTARARKTA